MVGRKKKKSIRRISRHRAKKRLEKRKTAPARKVVLLVIDGLADTPQKREGKDMTPLSAAKKPNMDLLVAKGAVGELVLTPAKAYPTSHISNIALLGYNPKRYYLRRGPLEAVGVDIPYKEGHLALRCNFATVSKDPITKALTVIDRRAGRSTEGLNEIARYINQNLKLAAGFVFIRTYGHRGVLIVKEQLSDQISSNDPGVAGLAPRRIQPLDSTELAKHSADVVQEFIDASHNIIEYHPKNAERMDKGMPAANYVLVREPGNRLVALPNCPRRWKLKRAVCIAENGAMKATCMLAGFNSITVPELGAEATLDFVFENIDSTLTEYDFIYAHIKGVDEAGHDGDFQAKQNIIEAIDRKLDRFRNFNGILVITCDHITSCEHKEHMPGPVPVLVYGAKDGAKGKKGKAKGKVKTFDEFAAKKGSLKQLSGRQLWKYVFGR